MNTTLAKPATILPPPGAYPDIPFAVYRAWPAVNKSTLDHIHNDTPLHCLHRMENPENETEAMIIGRAFHTLTLEGNGKYCEQFVASGQCSAKKRDGSQCVHPGKYLVRGEWLCGVHGDASDGDPRTILTAEMAAVAGGLYWGVLECQDALEFLESDGPNELSLLWVDDETGLPCKARLDMLRPGWNAIGDLKSCQSAHPRKFERQIEERGYARQGAFYLRGAAKLGLGVEHFALIPVEKEAPHAAALYLMDEDSLSIGDAEIRAALRTYADCKLTGSWPGYTRPADGWARCGLPAWAKSKRGN